MRTCENCKKVFDDDMNYCPYCGTKYHDYHEDLKNVMDELFDEETNVSKEKQDDVERTQVINVGKEEKTVVSRVEKQKKLKEEKENNMLNKILLVLITLLVVVFLGGSYFIVKTYFFKNNDTVVNEKLPENEQPQENDEPSAPLPDEDDVPQKDDQVQDTSDTPVNVIDESMEGENVTITAIRASNEDGQIRLDITCDSKTTGEIYLSDGASLNIGPIQLREGSNSFYFTLNVRENAQYTLSFQYEGGQDQMVVTYDMIMGALTE